MLRCDNSKDKQNDSYQKKKMKVTKDATFLPPSFRLLDLRVSLLNMMGR